jgi:hypothetical protein
MDMQTAGEQQFRNSLDYRVVGHPGNASSHILPQKRSAHVQQLMSISVKPPQELLNEKAIAGYRFTFPAIQPSTEIQFVSAPHYTLLIKAGAGEYDSRLLHFAAFWSSSLSLLSMSET